MYGLENQVTKINRAAVKLAKASVTDKMQFRNNWWETYRSCYND